jgi:sugar phosphate isomerase/epimerase
MDRAAEARRKFEDAGILVEIVKWDGLNAMSDDELDYCFQVSKAVGAKALSAELDLKLGARIAPFATKHQLPFGFHGHAQGPELFEQVMAQGPFNWINLDLGHFTANHGSPVPFIKQHHARITHVHVKDRKLNEGANTPLGEGDTPVRDVLRLMRDNKWPFQATIEFEYPVPEGSDRMTELTKCLAYCREALLS